MHGWQANKKRTCAQPVKFRVIPENEIPPAMRVDVYLYNENPAIVAGFREGYSDCVK